MRKQVRKHAQTESDWSTRRRNVMVQWRGNAEEEVEDTTKELEGLVRSVSSSLSHPQSARLHSSLPRCHSRSVLSTDSAWLAKERLSLVFKHPLPTLPLIQCQCHRTLVFRWLEFCPSSPQDELRCLTNTQVGNNFCKACA